MYTVPYRYDIGYYTMYFMAGNLGFLFLPFQGTFFALKNHGPTYIVQIKESRLLTLYRANKRIEIADPILCK